MGSMAPQPVVASNVPSENKGVSHQVTDVLGVVERVPELAPPTVPSGPVPQDDSNTAQPQPLERPHSGQL